MDEETQANASDPNQPDPNAGNEALTDEQKQQLQDELAAEFQAPPPPQPIVLNPVNDDPTTHTSFGR